MMIFHGPAATDTVRMWRSLWTTVAVVDTGTRKKRNDFFHEKNENLQKVGHTKYVEIDC
jgi:hypothetical protein